MSSVLPIDHDETFPQDALTAQDRVDSAKLQTQVADIKDKLNEQLDVLDGLTRDDDTLRDQLIRLRMCHPELIAALAAASAWQAKTNARVATVANITLTGALTTDGVALADGDRVLVTGQALPKQNGLYVVNTGGAWARSTDCDTAEELAWALVNVTAGTVYAGTSWLQSATVATLGTSAVTFALVFAPKDVTVGAASALTKVGTSLSVNVDGVTTEIVLNAIRVKDLGITTAKMADAAITGVKIADGVVSNAKLATMAATSLKGNATGGVAAPVDLTAAMVAAILPSVVGDAGTGGTKGLVPAPGAGDAAAGKFFNAAGGWSVPAGTAGVNIQCFKDSCVVATIGNITLSSTQTIDGVALAVNDRVLVRAQTASADNGIYTVQAGAWTRATDADTAVEMGLQLLVAVAAGTVLGGTVWRLSLSTLPTLGVTALVFKPLDSNSYGELRCRRYTAGSYPGAAPTTQYTSQYITNGVSSNGQTYSCLNWTGQSLRGAAFLNSVGGKLVCGPAGEGDYLVEFEGLAQASGSYATFLQLWKDTAIGAASAYIDDSASDGFYGLTLQRMHAVVTLAVGDAIYVRGRGDFYNAANYAIVFSGAVLRATRIKV